MLVDASAEGFEHSYGVYMAALPGDNCGASSDLGLDELCILQGHSRVYLLLLCRILLEPCGLIAIVGG